MKSYDHIIRISIGVLVLLQDVLHNTRSTHVLIVAAVAQVTTLEIHLVYFDLYTFLDVQG